MPNRSRPSIIAGQQRAPRSGTPQGVAPAGEEDVAGWHEADPSVVAFDELDTHRALEQLA
jgi:hypothetical protein